MTPSAEAPPPRTPQTLASHVPRGSRGPAGPPSPQGGGLPTIGILGGTFDPIHNGHLDAARELLEVADLDQVWLMPNAHPPHRHEPLAGPQDRMRMVELAVKDAHRLVPSRIEVERGGTSYTIDTIHELEQRFPGQAFVLLLGIDAAQHIREWHEAARLLAEACFVIFNRPGTTLEPKTLDELGFDPGRTRMVQLKTPDVAAHEIRERLQGGLSIDDLVPPAVARYIRERHLYGAGSSAQLG
jgi:nicotinate-nucleotide adenylyltransferase